MRMWLAIVVDRKALHIGASFFFVYNYRKLSYDSCKLTISWTDTVASNYTNMVSVS